ncbi:MAG: hydroxyphenylacetyl-CoA thioesterase PaaI [Alphaproteobacteria bacterium]|nr:hydroxyphenylacetyl-CoA thioesterase PaaI [Alphaproteobacteria bacterium]
MDAGHTVGAADVLARRVADAMYEQDDASRNLGIRLEAVGAGWARMSMPVTEGMLNGHRVCHGGYVFSLADSAMAFASNSRNRVSVAQFCSITFLRPGRPDQVLLAEAREQADAGRTGLYAVEVREEDGEIIAVFSGAVRRLGERTIV